MIHKICKSDEKQIILDIIIIVKIIWQRASHKFRSKNSERMWYMGASFSLLLPGFFPQGRGQGRPLWEFPPETFASTGFGPKTIET